MHVIIENTVALNTGDAAILVAIIDIVRETFGPQTRISVFDGEPEVAGVPEAVALQQLDARKNFDDKAALVQALDLVVSVDTSHAHLAGALDVPVWLLLPYAADWRWGVAGDRTPWYPRARLFRQSAARRWEAPVAAIGQALQRSTRNGDHAVA